jgi:hypothetical protein
MCKCSVILILILLFQLSLAQNRPGSITGKVLNLETKELLSKANVVLYTSRDKGYDGVLTDTNGHFDLKNIPAGIYKLKVSYIGYQASTLEPLIVRPDSCDTLSIQLDPYMGYSAEDARKDLANGKVRIYEGTWFLVPGQSELAHKYGFEIEQTGCSPLGDSRYNSIVYAYLDRINGKGWFYKYKQELDSLAAIQKLQQKTKQ